MPHDYISGADLSVRPTYATLETASPEIKAHLRMLEQRQCKDPDACYVYLWPSSDENTSEEEMAEIRICRAAFKAAADALRPEGTPRVNIGNPLSSKVWEHFLRVMTPKGYVKALCHSCETTSFFGGSFGTAALNSHVKSIRHQQKYRRLQTRMTGEDTKEEDEKIPVGKRSVYDMLVSKKMAVTSIIPVQRINDRDMTLPGGVYDGKTARKYLMEAMVSANFPLATIGDPYVRRCLRYIGKAYNFEPMSRSTLARDLRQECEAILDSIRDTLLPKTNKVSIACDAWTSPNSLPFISYIAYYVGEDWTFREVQLGFEFAPGKHDGVNMASITWACLTRVGLHLPGRLLAITTDSASNNGAMARALHEGMGDLNTKFDVKCHIPCMAHIIQLVTGAFMNKLGVQGRASYFADQERDVEDEQFIRDGDGNYIYDKRGRRKKMRGVRMHRFTCLDNGFSKTIEKLRRLAVVIRLSTLNRTSFLALLQGRERYAVLPVNDVKTRWNSTVVMIQRAYRLRSYITQWVLSEPQYWPLMITPDEWAMLEYIMTVLEPFQYWTLYMSRRRTVTLHLLVRLYNDMFEHLEHVDKALKRKDCAWKKDIHLSVGAAKSKLMERYDKITPETGLLILLAVMLDPFSRLQTFRKWDRDLKRSQYDPASYTQEHAVMFMEYFIANYIENPVNETSDASGDLHRSSSMSGADMPDYIIIESDDEQDTVIEQFSSQTSPSRATHSTNTLRTPSNSFCGQGDDSTDDHIRKYREHENPYVKAAYHYLTQPPDKRPTHAEKHRTLNGDYELDIDNPDKEVPDFAEDEFLRSFWKPRSSDAKLDLAPLAAMAKDVFSAIANSVGVESSFSVARKSMSWQQKSMNHRTLRAYVITRQHLKRKNDERLDEAEILKAEYVERLEHIAQTEDYRNLKAQIGKRRQRRKAERREKLHTEGDGLGLISDEEAESKTWEEVNCDGAVYARLIQSRYRLGDERPQRSETTTHFAPEIIRRKVRRLGREETDLDALASSSDESDDEASRSREQNDHLGVVNDARAADWSDDEDEEDALERHMASDIVHVTDEEAMEALQLRRVRPIRMPAAIPQFPNVYIQNRYTTRSTPKQTDTPQRDHVIRGPDREKHKAHAPQTAVRRTREKRKAKDQTTSDAEPYATDDVDEAEPTDVYDGDNIMKDREDEEQCRSRKRTRSSLGNAGGEKRQIKLTEPTKRSARRSTRSVVH